MIQDAGWGGGQHRMARPYSHDLRDRVVRSVASGRTCRATAALFGVSVASVSSTPSDWRQAGSTQRADEGYYNRARIHSAIGYITPQQAEAEAA